LHYSICYLAIIPAADEMLSIMQPNKPNDTILCVDDHEDTCELVSFMLKPEGYNVVSVHDGNQALDIIGKRQFALIILDYHLPGVSGVELCRKLKETKLTTPVIFFTASAYPHQRDEGLAAGADDYLLKPNDLSRLIQVVNQLLQNACGGVKTLS